MTEEEKKKAIVGVLGSEDKQRYYVYALVDSENNEVFYIGKGQQDRVWQHEESAATEKKKILDDSTLSEEEKSRQLEDISAKHARIDRIGKQNVNKVIIKWGLTEKEAFAAESALINLYRFQGIDLTNIQNGHASDKEKEYGGGTEAYEVSKFYDKFALSPISYSSLCVSKSDDATIIFINVAREYKSSMGPKQIMDAARCRWGIKEKNELEYLFAVNRSVIVGIFKIEHTYSGTQTENMPENTEMREKEKNLLQRIGKDRKCEEKAIGECKEICYDNLSDDLKEEIKEYCKQGIFFKKCKKEDDVKDAFKNWFKRKYFTCRELSQEEKENFKIGERNYDYDDDLINHRIIKECGGCRQKDCSRKLEGGSCSLFYRIQSPFRYNHQD